MNKKYFFSIISKNETETMLFGKNIAKFFSSGNTILLNGNLGIGKTYFTKGFVEAFNTSNNVTSPTFSIANFYNSSNNTIIHIDLYRLETTKEFINLGLDDYFENSIVIVEWGLKFPELFSDYILISIEKDENLNYRKISLSSEEEKYINIIEKIKNIYE